MELFSIRLAMDAGQSVFPHPTVALGKFVKSHAI
jgi:hypothetical protein